MAKIPNFQPTIDLIASAELSDENRRVQGTVENTTGNDLINLVAYFVLYGASTTDLLGIIPALPSDGLNNGIWNIGDSLSYSVAVNTIPDNDFAAVQSVELMVVAYYAP